MEKIRVEPMQITQFLLLLHSIAGIGDKTLSHILRYMEQHRLSPKEVLGFPVRKWREELLVSGAACKILFETREALLEQSKQLESLRKRRDVYMLYQGSASYPAQLDQYEEVPPPIIYARGNLALLEENRSFTFTVVASNKPTPHHLDQLYTRTKQLSQEGGTVVTGHDRLPYQRAALAAHSIARPILYVFDRGLREALGADFSITPFAAARIHEVEFNTEVDLGLSPFRLDDHALAFNLKRRDRLIFSLADLIIAQDVKSNGVMFGECRRALLQNRPVYVAPDGRDGNGLLLEEGARPLPQGKDWVAQIFEELLQNEEAHA